MQQIKFHSTSSRKAYAFGIFRRSFILYRALLLLCILRSQQSSSSRKSLHSIMNSSLKCIIPASKVSNRNCCRRSWLVILVYLECSRHLAKWNMLYCSVNIIRVCNDFIKIHTYTAGMFSEINQITRFILLQIVLNYQFGIHI